ncbi:MAG: YceD family protein [Bacteroidales bacterium]|jgi:uncharacterized metal-binding protein YceD (DUF177 family)|nr:YceD family protein [Bacteroidales bacterium]MCI2121939.1 YceD family protein [Bacteroidales bacterium]MCI2145470.1 YceD family protein [Bacteroidales bacterium]
MEGNESLIVIPIGGLSAGRHSFDFDVDGSFFKAFGNRDIKDASVKVNVEVLKESLYLGVVCAMKGVLVVECDRCLDDLPIDVDITRNLTVKFTAVDGEPEDDEVLVLDKGESELDLDQFVYDHLCLSVPIKKVHPEGQCNAQMMAKLRELSGEDQEDKETTNPFSGLKDLLDKKN